MEGNTIYYKEAPEKVESLYDLLLDYFNKKSPQTFDSKTNELQCAAARNRSVDDLMLLANHYFPGTDIKTLMKTYLEISKNMNKEYCWRLCFFVCHTINKPVLLIELYSLNVLLINDLLYGPHLNDKSKSSKYTLMELKEILES